MDDIDEGIGSNESSISSKDRVSLIDSLKYLNGIQTTDNYGEVEHLSIHDSFISGLPGDQVLSKDNKNFNNCTNGEKCHGNVEKYTSVLNGHLILPEEKSVAEELVDLADNKDETVATVLPANHQSYDKSPLASSIVDVDSTQDHQKGFVFTENETQFHEDTQLLTAENSVSCNSRESEKSPFVLDDKIRNSLKGLVAKMKFFPDRKSESKNITDSDADKINDTDRTEMIAIKKDTSTEKLQKSEKQEPDEERDNNDYKGSLDKTAGLIQGDTAKSCCTSQEITTNDTTASEKLISRNSSLLSLDADMFKNCDDNDRSIPMEIGSDNEDMLLQMSPGNHKIIESTRKPNIDEVQFDEDSSSQTSDNSGKINDIVKFLSDDLPNSPLAISNSGSANKPTPLHLNLNKSESRSKDIPNKELDSKSAKSSIELLKDAENNAFSPISKLSNECKEVDVTINKISDEEIVNPKEKNEISFKTEKDGHDDNIQQEMLKAKIFPDSNTDDDIIFEGETNPAANSKLEVKVTQEDLSSHKNGNSQIVSANTNCINIVENKMELTGNDLTCNKLINVSVSDDDVIFEKEIKADDISKQNCDILRINTNAVKTCVKDQDLLLYNENKYDSQSESKYRKFENLGIAQADRKRPAEEENISEVISKRSKLQGLIGKLEARVEPSKLEASVELANIELSDSDVDNSATTDTAHERDSLCSEEDILVKNQEVKQKTITLTELELEAMVREKVKAYLTSQRDTIIARLSQKVKELQTNNDLWKRQVKDLQVKVNDVTVLQKKLEKRKAATAALRQITTRHVAIQVEEGRTINSSKAKTAITPTKSSPANGPVLPSGDTRTIRLPITQSTINQSVLTPHSSQPAQLVTNAYITPSVKSLLDTTRMQRTVGSVMPVTSAATSIVSLLQYPTGYVTQASTSQGYLTMPGAVVTPVTANVSKIVPKAVQSHLAGNTITLTSSNSKVIDLTDDDDIQKTCRVTLPTGFTMNAPGVRHVLAAPPGAQLVRTGTSAQPTYQLVFNPTSPVLRPVNVVASTPGQTGTLLQAVSPKNVVNLASAAGITSGSTLAHVVVTAAPTIVQPKMALTHPAPFPSIPKDQALDGRKAILPKPTLKISRVSQGIVLSWNMVMTDNVAEISIYQLFAYQETLAPPSSALWKKVGDVKALPLPMACTLTQFQVGNKYHFAVRAVDVHQQVGQFSDPGSIHLTPGPPVM